MISDWNMPEMTGIEQPEFRRDFVTTIEGYGEGRMSILVA